jgi:glyoxylase-like metal-dependent hydrolase (beta-lactamase superfamily II)
MRIRAIRTGAVAVKERQREGSGPGPMRVLTTMVGRSWTEPLPILAWLIEHPEGLIVVDTGETARALERGYFTSWNPYFRFGVREWVTADEEIGVQLRALGHEPDDVRWVVLTHLHTDHAGGLAHFPRSEILVSAVEVELATGTAGKARGYLPQHWPAWFAPTRIEFDPVAYGPFQASRALTDAGDVVLLPTPGHTAGHLSVAVRDRDRLVFLAGDTSYTEQLMRRGVADGVTNDPETARRTLTLIRELATSEPMVYLPSHDPDSARRLELSQASCLAPVA